MFEHMQIIQNCHLNKFGKDRYFTPLMVVNSCTWLLSLSVFLLLPVDWLPWASVSSQPLLTSSLPLICSTVQCPPSLHFTLFTSAHLAPRCPAQSSVEEPSRWRLTSPLFACLGSAHGTVKRETLGVRGRYLLSFCISLYFPSGFQLKPLAMWSGWRLLDLIS